jgi:hypothetical protein
MLAPLQASQRLSQGTPTLRPGVVSGARLLSGAEGIEGPKGARHAPVM